MKEIGNGTKSINLRTVGIAIGGGAVLILVAAQLLAKSADTTRVARAVSPSALASGSGTSVNSSGSAESLTKTTTGGTVVGAGNTANAVGRTGDAAGRTASTAGPTQAANGAGNAADAAGAGKTADGAGTTADATGAGKTAGAAGAGKIADAAGTAQTAVPGRSPLVAEPPLRELFGPLVVKDTPKPAAAASLRLPPARADLQPKKPAIAGKNDAAPVVPVGPSARDIQMLGVVEADSGAKALLKKTTTGESRYFTKGEDVFGFTLQEIKSDAVTLTLNGRTETVAMSTAIPIEGPGASAVAATSPFARQFGPGAGPGGFQRGNRRGNRGEGGGGGGEGAAPQSPADAANAQIMALEGWKARVAKLESLKASFAPDKYESLHKFMADRAAAEGK